MMREKFQHKSHHFTFFSVVSPQVFQPLVDRVGLGSLVPVEYFGNKNLDFLSDNKTVRRFEVSKLVLIALIHPAELAKTVHNDCRNNEPSGGVVILVYLF